MFLTKKQRTRNGNLYQIRRQIPGLAGPIVLPLARDWRGELGGLWMEPQTVAMTAWPAWSRVADGARPGGEAREFHWPNSNSVPRPLSEKNRSSLNVYPSMDNIYFGQHVHPSTFY